MVSFVQQSFNFALVYLINGPTGSRLHLFLKPKWKKKKNDIKKKSNLKGIYLIIDLDIVL